MQHYVPRFLLSRFHAAGRPDQVYTYDKVRGRSFLAGVGKVGKERGLYDISIDGVTLTFEPSLGELESLAAGAIGKVLDRGEVGFLSAPDRETIARFVLAQNFRTRQFVEYVNAGGKALADALDPRAPGSAASMGFRDDPEESRMLALRLLERSGDHVPLLLEKAWVLYEAPEDYPFWLGDHPVALCNNVNQSGVRGTIGLAVPGIEISLPISSWYCIGFLCKTLKSMTIEAYAQSLRARELHDVELPHHDAVGAIRDGLEYGFPIPSKPENIEFANLLQVLHAERFVFSSRHDFRMVDEMIEQNPENRRGPRPEIK